MQYYIFSFYFALREI